MPSSRPSPRTSPTKTSSSTSPRMHTRPSLPSMQTSIRFQEPINHPLDVPTSPTDTIASGYSSITSYTQTDARDARSGRAQESFPLPTPSTKFALALYPYSDTDPAILNFSKGDIIEIISEHPSGWWDGLVGGTWNGYGLGGSVRRGWLPSNYVRMLHGREEARTALTRANFSRPEKGRGGHGTLKR